MAGYGYERMKLKEYLGIEWIENGFNETGMNNEVIKSIKIRGQCIIFVITLDAEIFSVVT